MIRKPKILYVDDEKINLQLFVVNLEEKYNVLTAEGPQSGLQILEEHPDIKVVFSDMRMPSMNGVQFITLAKEKYPEIIFFILTGYDITEEIQNAIDKGLILKYISKPADMNKIAAEIENVINCG